MAPIRSKFRITEQVPTVVHGPTSQNARVRPDCSVGYHLPRVISGSDLRLVAPYAVGNMSRRQNMMKFCIEAAPVFAEPHTIACDPGGTSPSSLSLIRFILASSLNWRKSNGALA